MVSKVCILSVDRSGMSYVRQSACCLCFASWVCWGSVALERVHHHIHTLWSGSSDNMDFQDRFYTEDEVHSSPSICSVCLLRDVYCLVDYQKPYIELRLSSSPYGSKAQKHALLFFWRVKTIGCPLGHPIALRQFMYCQSASEFRLEPCRLRRHYVAGVCDIDKLFH